MKPWTGATLLFFMSISGAHSQQLNKCVIKTGAEYRSGPDDGGVTARA